MQINKHSEINVILDREDIKKILQDYVIAELERNHDIDMTVSGSIKNYSISKCAFYNSATGEVDDRFYMSLEKNNE